MLTPSSVLALRQHHEGWVPSQVTVALTPPLTFALRPCRKGWASPRIAEVLSRLLECWSPL
jgi:hypothetical protein